MTVRDGRNWPLRAHPSTALGDPAAGAGRAGTASLVTGVPSSPGRARGPARLVRSVDDFARVRRGDVLVCRTTDPAWTPLFRLAAAVVTETGGVLSHAAIVAREFGIPAVVGAVAAMTSLTDGVPVTVDGTVGTITAGGG
jgi:pyruvate,water dikinase